MPRDNVPMDALPLPSTPKATVSALLSWYRANRRELPWRERPTPYAVWVSEIMLQQTRVEAVKDYYTRFLSALPTVYDLAAVPDEVLMKLWQGLGYYARARNLKRGALEILARFGGEIPEKTEELLTIPGIGSYTAGAIASIAYGHPAPAVDGNVLRVYARLTGDGHDIGDPKTKGLYEKAIVRWMPTGEGFPERNDCGDFTQGLIELGATVCLPKGEPCCSRCPLSEFCLALREGRIAELPVKGGRAARRIVPRTVVLLSDRERIALCRREENGLLAGLYEPLSFDGHLQVDELVRRLCALGFSPETVDRLPDARHIFTHLEWQMWGYAVTVPPEDVRGHRGALIFRTPAEIAESYAIPSAYRAYLTGIAGGQNA